MKPKFKKLARENEGAVFVMVDAEKLCALRVNWQRWITCPRSRRSATARQNQAQTNKFEVLKELVDAVATTKHIGEFITK